MSRGHPSASGDSTGQDAGLGLGEFGDAPQGRAGQGPGHDCPPSSHMGSFPVLLGKLKLKFYCCWLFHFPSPGSTTRSRGRSSPARCIPQSRQPWRNPPPRNILGQRGPPAPAQDPLTAQHPSSFQAAAAPPSSLFLFSVVLC